MVCFSLGQVRFCYVILGSPALPLFLFIFELREGIAAQQVLCTKATKIIVNESFVRSPMYWAAVSN